MHILSLPMAAAASSTVPQSSSTSSTPQNTISTHSTELVRGSHEFTVAGYSLQKRKGAGHSIMSGSFEVGGYRWVVQFYPAGESKEEEGHISVYLELRSTVVDKVTAWFTFGVNGASGSSLHMRGSFDDYTPTSKSWGYPKFMEIETVESEYLINDCLTLLCDVEVVKTVKTGETISCFITVPPPAIFRDLELLLESKEGSDVTLQLEQSEYDAHRAVLAARSPVFSAQFFGPMADEDAAAAGSRRNVRIHDIKPAVFEAVLHFVYTDTLPPATTSWSASHRDKRPKLSDVAAASCSEEEVRVMIGERLAAADRFDLERMRLLCEDALWETIDVANAAATLRLADRHHCPQLKELCMEYIASAGVLAAVMTTEGFRELKLDCPSLLIEILENFGKRSEADEE
uniref:MATH domain-containing protein n=2 Tax=Oryza glaberrima TaxID=4538 RepID=I1QIJ3_ORYGL